MQQYKKPLWLLIIALHLKKKVNSCFTLHLICCKWCVKWSTSSPMHKWLAGGNRRACRVELFSSLDNEVLCSVSAPWDSWLSEHIPLAAIHAAAPPRRYAPLSLYAVIPLVLPCPLLLFTPQTAVTLHSVSVSLYASVFIFPFAVTFISLPHRFRRIGGAPFQQLPLHLSSLIAKLATVFNHSHPAKSHEVIKNF